MGKIEELPDDFDESLDLSKSTPTSTTDDGQNDCSAAPKPAPEAPFPIDRSKAQPADPMAPELPPAMASVRSHSTQELADMMKKTPLFMTDINDAGDDEEANNMLDAIRALQHEGTRGEVALNFREQGNEAAKAKDWKNAKEYYDKGLAVLNVKPGSKQDKWEKPKDEKEEERMQREAREACLINRALCNLELSRVILLHLLLLPVRGLGLIWDSSLARELSLYDARLRGSTEIESAQRQGLLPVCVRVVSIGQDRGGSGRGVAGACR